MRSIKTHLFLPLFALLLSAPANMLAQQTAGSATAPATLPRQSGTVKAVTPQDFVLTNAAGQDFAVNLSPATRILLVDPATRDIKSARPGTVADIAGGDKAVVSGTAGDTGQTLTATRVLLLKSGAIAAMHAEEQAAWAHSVGGVVRSVDAAAGTLTLANGQRLTTITTTPSTVVRRYAGGSVRFQDAVKSSVAAIRPGDQAQARGQRSADGSTLAADEIVEGSFSNFSGLLTSVDAAAGTVSLKDLATKKPVTVLVTSQTNLRKLPAGFAQSLASRAGTANGAPATGQGHPGEAANGAGGGGAGGGRNGQMDLSRVVNRLPTQTLADLKPGEAVMIVASNSSEGEPGAEAGPATAITLLSGVEQLLSSSAAGQTTLAPWSLGGSDAAGADAGGSGGGR